MSMPVVPIAKNGNCPSGYRSSGNMCIPNAGAKPAIAKTVLAHHHLLTKDGAFFAGKVLPLSLSCDHRVVDGAEGSRFLRTVIGLLENPERLMPTI